MLYLLKIINFFKKNLSYVVYVSPQVKIIAHQPK